MIKFLKFLWKKCFGSVGDSRMKVVKNTSTDLPIILVKPRPLHCDKHNRFKKSCSNCLTAVGVK